MKKTKIEMLFTIPSAFLAATAIYLYWFDINAKNGKQFLWLLLFGVFAYFMQGVYSKNTEFVLKKRFQKFITAGLSLLFSLFYVIGSCLHKHNNLDSILPGGESFYKALFSVLGFICLFFSLLQMLFTFISRYDFTGNSIIKASWLNRIAGANITSFLCSWGVTMLCWLPYLISLFPGVLTSDSLDQQMIASGDADFTNHHPAIHTFMISGCMKLGTVFSDNPNIGVAIYSVIQMLAMSAIFAYFVFFLAKQGVKLWIRFASLALFALFPVHAIYSVTMWKDILFGGLTLLVCIQLFDILQDAGSFFKSKPRIIMLAFLLFFFSVWRNNGFYVFILMVPILMIAFRKYWKQMLVVCLIPLVLYGVYKGPLFEALDIKEGSAREALSVPLQQIARTVRDHGDDITQEEREMIDKYVPIDEIGKHYNPRLSDPVKNSFKDEAFEEDKATLIKVWAKLLLRHPVTYVESFLCNNHGYWFPDVDYWICAYTVHSNSLDIIQTGGGEGYIKSIIGTMAAIPIVSMLLSIGLSFWLVCLCAAIFLMKKRKILLIPVAFIMLLWLTATASPVHSEFRYVYGMIVCVPLCICMALTAEKFPEKINKQIK